MIKSYNKENEIVIISHDNYTNLDVSDIRFLFCIAKAVDQELNKSPIKSNETLYSILNNANYSKKESNMDFERKKKENKAKERKKLINRIKRKLGNRKKIEDYIHFHQC